jgi:hypothetical protein
MDDDLMREVDDPRFGETGENAALHHADKWPLVAEVGCDGDDA